MTRICPACKGTLGTYDNYFCSACGSQLPPELVRVDRFQRRIVKTQLEVTRFSKILEVVSSPKSKKIAFRSAIAFAAIVFLYLGGKSVWFYGQKFWRQENKTIETKAGGVFKPGESAKKISPYALDAKISYLDGELGLDNIISYIPSDVDLYIEGYDISKFGDSLTGFNPNTSLDYKDLFEDIETKIDPHFAFFIKKFADEYSSGFIVIPASGPIQLSKTYGNIKIVDLGKALVISEKEELTKEVGDVVKGNTKNLSLNLYASAKPNVPSRAQFFILPTTRNGKAYLFKLLEEKLPDDLKLVLNKFLDSKLDYAVVIKE